MRLGISTGACVLFVALGARAQSIDPAAATELFKQGREEMLRGDLASGCPKLAESARLDAKVGTFLNLAECEEKQGHLAASRQALQRAIDVARQSNDDRVVLAQQRFDAIDKRVPRLTIKLASDAPASAAVKRDAVSLGVGSLGAALPIDPGAHTIIVSCAGFADRSYPITVKEGESSSLEVTVGEAKTTATVASTTPASAADRPTETVPPPVTHLGTPPTRTAGFVIGSVAVAAIAGGAITGLMAMTANQSANSDHGCIGTTCADQTGVDLRHQASVTGDVSTALFIAGGVALAGGVLLVVLAPSSKPARAATFLLEGARF